MAASVLVVLGVFCKRVWLLFTAFIEPNIAGGPGVTVGNQNLVGDTAYAMAGSYAPTPVEIMIVIGVIALAVLAFEVIGSKVFKKTDNE